MVIRYRGGNFTGVYSFKKNIDALRGHILAVDLATEASRGPTAVPRSLVLCGWPIPSLSSPLLFFFIIIINA